MSESGYMIAKAAADLRSEGLLAGFLLPDSGQVTAFDEGSLDRIPPQDSFLGAGLDSRSLLPGELFVALPGERCDGRDFIPRVLTQGNWALTGLPARGTRDTLLGAPAPAGSGVLLSPDPARALARLSCLWRTSLGVKVVGITGSNGKTTTKDLLAALLGSAGPTLATRGNYNNELGLPLTLLGLRSSHRYAVVEMGASAVGDIAALAGLARPSVGIITNAAPAHLARFQSLTGVIRGKGELLQALPPEGTAILNADSPGFERWSTLAHCPVVSFGESAGDHRWTWRPDEQSAGGWLSLDAGEWQVPLPGKHNAANLAAAILAARTLGLADDKMRQGLGSFQASAHRAQILKVGGRRILDDCYNANPASMGAACRMLVEMPGPGRNFAVLGAMAELGPTSEDLHLQTGKAVQATGVDVLVAVGEKARPLAAGFDATGDTSHYCPTRTEAAEWLANQTRPGDRLLIKGSRSVAMDQLIPLLVDRFSKDEG